MDTSEKINTGGFKVTENGELGSMRVLLHINGVSSLAGSEELVLTLYSDAALTKPVYVSSASTIAAIAAVDDTFGNNENWVGWLRFDFARENINKNIYYYPGIEANNYTRVADFWMGFSYDFPAPVYDNGESSFFKHNLAYQIFTYR